MLARLEGDEGIVGLSQSFRPEALRGQRIQLTAWALSRDIEGYGFFYVRVDGKEVEDVLAFDNMTGRSLSGTSDEWQAHRIVVDVPAGSASVGFGAILNGMGQLWIDDLSFTVVSNEIAVTDMMKTMGADPMDHTVIISDSFRVARSQRILASPAAPRNLGFEEQ